MVRTLHLDCPGSEFDLWLGIRALKLHGVAKIKQINKRIFYKINR